MAWLRKIAEVEEIVVLNPGMTKAGPCALCMANEGQPVSLVGFPPFHSHCACGVEERQTESQPSEIIQEEVGIEPPAPEELEPDPGMVEVI